MGDFRRARRIRHIQEASSRHNYHASLRAVHIAFCIQLKLAGVQQVVLLAAPPRAHHTVTVDHKLLIYLDRLDAASIRILIVPRLGVQLLDVCRVDGLQLLLRLLFTL